MKKLLSIIAAILLLTSIGCTWGNEFEAPDLPQYPVTEFVARDFKGDYKYADIPRGPGFLLADLPDAPEYVCGEDAGERCDYNQRIDALTVLDSSSYQYVAVVVDNRENTRPMFIDSEIEASEENFCYSGYDLTDTIGGDNGYNIVLQIPVMCFFQEDNVLFRAYICGCDEGYYNEMELNINLSFDELS